MIAALIATVRRYFRSFASLFRPLRDGRQLAKVLFPMAEIGCIGLLMFLFRLSARRRIGLDLRNAYALGNLQALFPKAFAVPHGDTVNQALCQSDPEDWQEVICSVVEQLLRRKVLQPFRLFDRFYVVAIDATGIISYASRHCPHCLTARHGSETTYYHNALEAKIVTPQGQAFSLMTEFIENEAPDVTKQDCEIKAFRRLAERLAKRFPRLPLCLSMDGLYACGPVFEICRKHGWHFVVTLKDKDLPSVEQEFQALSKLEPHETCVHRPGHATTKQRFRWVNDIDYVDTNRVSHRLVVVECTDIQTVDGAPPTQRLFKWVTDFAITNKNVAELANNGGRIRWKIENEGFNVQKNGGFGLEHAYSQDPTAAKAFYFLLQLAHTISQLIEMGTLLRSLATCDPPTGSQLARRLLEAWRNCVFSAEQLLAISEGRFQIRLNTS